MSEVVDSLLKDGFLPVDKGFVATDPELVMHNVPDDVVKFALSAQLAFDQPLPLCVMGAIANRHCDVVPQKLHVVEGTWKWVVPVHQRVCCFDPAEEGEERDPKEFRVFWKPNFYQLILEVAEGRGVKSEFVPSNSDEAIEIDDGTWIQLTRDACDCPQCKPQKWEDLLALLRELDEKRAAEEEGGGGVAGVVEGGEGVEST